MWAASPLQSLCSLKKIIWSIEIMISVGPTESNVSERPETPEQKRGESGRKVSRLHRNRNDRVTKFFLFRASNYFVSRVATLLFFFWCFCKHYQTASFPPSGQQQRNSEQENREGRQIKVKSEWITCSDVTVTETDPSWSHLITNQQIRASSQVRRVEFPASIRVSHHTSYMLHMLAQFRQTWMCRPRCSGRTPDPENLQVDDQTPGDEKHHVMKRSKPGKPVCM